MPVSRNLRWLILNTVDAGATFGDAQLASWRGSRPTSLRRNWDGPQSPTASFDTLGKFTHLRALHLEGTAITGAGLAKLAPLSQLSYLNLSGTKVTQAALAPLESMKNLRHLYLYNTPAQPARRQQARNHEPTEFCAMTGIAALGALLAAAAHADARSEERSLELITAADRQWRMDLPELFRTGDNCPQEPHLAALTAALPPTRPGFSTSALRVRPGFWFMTATESC